MGVRITGATSGLDAETTANKELQVALGKTDATTGYAIPKQENDPGVITGTPYLKSVEASGDYRMRVGADSFLFQYFFASTTQDTGVWRYLATSAMTATQAAGYLNLNPSATLTSGAGVSMHTSRYFSNMETAPLAVRVACEFTAVPLSGQVMEWGLFAQTASNAVPADGCFWRLTSSGLYAVLTYGGVENAVLISSFTVSPNTAYNFVIVAEEGAAEFWVNDVLQVEVAAGAGNAQLFLSDALPLGLQSRNSSLLVGTPAIIKIGDVGVSLEDILTNQTLGMVYSAMGRSHQGLAGGTMGSLAVMANNSNPTAAAIVNATAAAIFTGLGGHTSVLPTLTAFTDGILFSYQNPVGSTTQPARELMIRGVWLQGVVTTILAGGPVIYAYSLAFGHTAVSLAQAESGTFVSPSTKAPRRIALGIESYAATAPVGTLGQGVYLQLETDVVVHPGEFVAIAAKNLGVVTTTGAISFIAGFDHYFL